MSDAFRTLIVATANVELARAIAASFGPGGVGMWTTPLSPTGADPATHYISSGYIPEQFAYLVPCQTWEWQNEQMYQDAEGTVPVTGPDQPVGLVTAAGWVMTGSEPGDPVAVYNLAVEAGVSCTQDDVDDLFANADVTEEEPFVAMGRLGVQIVQPVEDLL